MSVTKKRCCRCGETKPLDKFHKNHIPVRYFRNGKPKKRTIRPNVCKYGIKPDDYDAMFEAQGGVCAICGAPPNGTRLSVDHDHKTGNVRGLLCVHCNAALGHAKDDENILRKMIAYLTGRRGQAA